MRILFCSFPAYGHIHPIMPLARASVGRGDDVLVAIGPDLCEWARRGGVEVSPAGRRYDYLSAKAAASFRGPARAAGMFAAVAVPPMIEDLLDVCARWRPDVIVHEESEYAAPVVAQLLRLPCVTHSWAAPARPRVERDELLEHLGPIWAEHGAGAARMTGERYLDACPPQFQTDAIDAVAEVSMIGAIRPVLYDGPPMVPPPWLDEVARPAAYVTFGTVSHFARAEILQSTIDAVSSVVADMIVTTGPNPVDRLSAPSARCHIERYLPQTLILPNVDVVVSNGGAGATLAAIYLGLPHVVIPQQPWSQLRNAQRIQALGIGIHVTDGSAPGAVAQATASALGDPSYRREAAGLRDTLMKLPTPDAVLRGLESAR